MSNVYCRAIFERGSGLGTRLFPWSRCMLFAQKHNLPTLSFHWVQPRVGPLIRGGIDIKSYKRQILLLGLFDRAENEIPPIRSAYLRSKLSHISEYQIDQNLVDFSNDSIIEFNGDRDRFGPLNGRNDEVFEHLLSITKKKWLDLVATYSEDAIGINVRLGNDFVVSSSPDDFRNKNFVKVPVSWYVDALKFLRKFYNADIPAYVVSDGTYEQLAPLLRMNNVFFVRPGCAISDLLILSKCKILIRNGASSFSAWASYFGQMPTLNHPGQSMSEFNFVSENDVFSGEFCVDQPSDELLSNLYNINF